MSRYYSLEFAAPSYAHVLDKTGKERLRVDHVTLTFVPSDILEKTILRRIKPNDESTGDYWELRGLWTYEKEDSELTDEEKEAIKLHRSLVEEV